MRVDSRTEVQIHQLDNSTGGEWISLVQLIGEDPSSFFEYGNWSDCDFSMSDMRSVSFKGAIIDRSVFLKGHWPSEAKEVALSALDVIEVDQPAVIADEIAEHYDNTDLQELKQVVDIQINGEHRDSLNDLIFSEATKQAAILAAGKSSDARYLSRLIKRHRTFSSALSSLDAIRRADFRPTKDVVDVISKKAPKFGDAIVLIRQFLNKKQMEDGFEFVILIKIASTVEEFREALQEMKIHGVKANDTQAAYFARGIKSLETFSNFLGAMKDFDVKPDYQVFHAVAPNIRGFDDAKRLLDLARAHNVQIDDHVFASLAKTVRTTDDFEEFSKFYEVFGVAITQQTLSTVVANFSNSEEALLLPERIDFPKSQLGVHFYSTVIAKAKSYEEAYGIFLMAKKELAQLDNQLLSAFAKYVVNRDLLEVFIKMLDENSFDVNPGVFSTLIKAIGTYEDAVYIFAIFRNRNGKPTHQLYSAMVNQTPSVKIAEVYLDEAIEQRVSNVEDVYNCVLKKAGTWLEAKRLIEKAYKNKTVPSDQMIATALVYRPGFGEAASVFERALERGMTPTDQAYTALLGCAEQYIDVLTVIEHFRESSTTFTDRIRDAVFKHAVGPDELGSAVSITLEFGNRPEERNFSASLKSCRNLEEFDRIFSIIQNNGVPFAKNTYDEKLRVCQSYNDIKRVVYEMEQRNIEPNAVSLNAALSMVNNFSDAASIIEIFAKHGATPDLSSVAAIARMEINERDKVSLTKIAISHGLQIEDTDLTKASADVASLIEAAT